MLCVVVLSSGQEEAKKDTVKESLVKKYAEGPAQVFADHPFVDFKEKEISAKEHAELTVKLLNFGEGFFAEIEKGLKRFGQLPEIVKHKDDMVKKLQIASLELFRLERDMKKQGIVIVPKYAVQWNGARWEAKELPKKK